MTTKSLLGNKIETTTMLRHANFYSIVAHLGNEKANED